MFTPRNVVNVEGDPEGRDGAEETLSVFSLHLLLVTYEKLEK